MRWYLSMLSLIGILCQGMAFSLDENYEIVLPETPAVVEQTAARELQHYLQRSAGLSLPVLQGKNTPGKKAVYLGWSAEVRQRLPEIALETLRPDEVVVRSFPDGTLVLTGEGSRGTLYAVYTWLEDVLGIRWLAPDAELVPSHDTVEIPALNFRYAPPIAVRSPDGAQFQPSQPAFLARMRVNGHSTPVEYGGNAGDYVLCNRSHTLSRLVPDEAFYRAHPDYYADDYQFPGAEPELFAWRDGRRITGEQGQPCLTNPEVKALVIANAVDLIRRRGRQTKSLFITQNDNPNYCCCPACEKLAAELGGQTDLLLWFLNDVAAELEKEFPGLTVETFAYRYTLEPPKSVKPRSNLRIRLCLIEADSRLPLTDDANRRFRDICVGWSKVTPHLAIWHYITNFTNYGLIHPNFASLAPNLRFFAGLGIEDVFSQDSRDAGSFGFFPELRGYLNARLLWNPELEPSVLTAEFLAAYYGAAAEKLQAYLKLNETALAAAKVRLDCYEMDTSFWLPYPVLEQGARLLEEAAAAVADDPVRLERVDRLRTSHDWTTLWRIENSPLQPLSNRPSTVDRQALRQSLDTRLPAIPKTPGYKGLHAREGVIWSQCLAELDRHLTPPAFEREFPAELRSVPPEKLIALPPAYVTPAQAETVADELAPNRRAVRLTLGRHNWAARVNLPATAGVGPVKVWAELRLPQNVAAADGIAALAGMYVYGTNFAEKSVIPIASASLSNTSYALIPLGEADFQRDCQIYFEGADNPTVPELLLARIWLEKE